MASKKSPENTKSTASKKARKGEVDAARSAVEPSLHQQAGAQSSHETQRFGEIVQRPHGLAEKVAKESVSMLNQSLADTMTLRDMYKKHHWQVVGPTFDQLHLMYDKHYEAQAELVDAIAERIQVLGGISLAMAADVAEATKIPRLPAGREPAPVQLSRLIDAHTHIIKQARASAEKASDAGDSGTDDLLVSEVLRTNELQVWFLSEHLVAASPI